MSAATPTLDLDSIRIPAPLQKRLDALSPLYDPQWFLDTRELHNDSHSIGSIPGHLTWSQTVEVGAGSRPDLETCIRFCISRKWRGCRILFCSPLLDADYRWPGGYDAPSICISNNKVFQERYEKELENADGDWDGLALDLRFISDEMLEDILSLQDYPLLDDCDHSGLELEQQQEAYENFVESDFKTALENRLKELRPDLDTNAQDYSQQPLPADASDLFWYYLRDEKLLSLFISLQESSNTYWEEQTFGWCSHGWWIDLDRMAAEADLEDFRELFTRSF